MSPQQLPLFSPDLISTTVQNQLPEGYLMRPLEITDFHKGFYDCLAGLTVVGKVSALSFEQTFETMRLAESVYYIVVIEDLQASRIVATGTLLVEQKFLRGCGKSGHIEDIVVHDSQRGKKFGIRLIDQLKHIGSELGCYKLLLTCSEANEPFYEKSGFERKDLNMAQYLNVSAQPPHAQSAIFGATIMTTAPMTAASTMMSTTTTTTTTTTTSTSTPTSENTDRAETALGTAVAASMNNGSTSSLTRTNLLSHSNNSISTILQGNDGTAVGATTINTNTGTAFSSKHSRNSSASVPPSSPSASKTLTRSQSVNGHGVPLENLSASMESVYVK